MTEIAPGMMVECLITSAKVGAIKGNKYFVLAIDNQIYCQNGHKNCRGLFLNGIKNPFEVLAQYKPFPEIGWASCCFRPIGGDKEIEAEQFKRIKATNRLNYLDKVKNHG